MKRLTLLVFFFPFLFISASKVPYKKFLKKTAFVFVPSGSYSTNSKAVSVNAFVMLNHEVTNLEYREFIKSNYLSKGDTLGAIAALPDTSAWNLDTTSYNQPYVNQYFNNSAYNNYPVVNVSKENAEKYCVWLTESIKKIYPESKFHDFRLPTKTEWIYAAKGGLLDNPYPWGGPYVRNSKGYYLAQFKIVDDQNIKIDENGKPKVVENLKFKRKFSQNMNHATTPVKSFLPNGYGLYNMAGNVAEMIATESKAMGGHWMSYGNDIQVTSEIEFRKANPMVGFRPIMSCPGK